MDVESLDCQENGVTVAAASCLHVHLLDRPYLSTVHLNSLILHALLRAHSRCLQRVHGILCLIQVTTVGFFRTLGIPKGKWLLQGAAGSHLGRQVIQVAKHYGVNIYEVIIYNSQFSAAPHQNIHL